jgi:arylsulfatase A-like enzyme
MRAWVAIGLSCVVVATCGAERPNIVVFVADDLGQRDLGCYGSTFYETPHLDRLAAEGARFTDAYATCPVCSPSRASLMTGMYPQRLGVTDYIGAPQPAKWTRNTRLLPAAYRERLDLETRTVAEALKESGYATFFAGKWHLGTESFYPEKHGFDINRGGIEKGGPYGGKQYFSPYGNPRLEDGPPGEHLPDRLGRETAAFIEANRDRPFLAWLSFYSVHTPLMAREDLRIKYEAKQRRLGLEAKWGREGERDVRLEQDHAVYAGMVEAMDLAVGTVLQKLAALGLDRKTLVLFTSDNGGLSTSEGWPTSNAPLRAGKGWLYEGGVRVPLIARWTGVIGPGRVIRDPVSGLDFFSTLVELAGAGGSLEANANRKPDGASLLSMVKSKTAMASRSLFWHYPHYGNQGGAPGSAMRQGRWKLIEWFEEDRLELFDLDRDPGERMDLAKVEKDRARSMREELKVWRQEVGAIVPDENPGYDPAKPSGRAATRPGAVKRQTGTGNQP